MVSRGEPLQCLHSEIDKYTDGHYGSATFRMVAGSMTEWTNAIDAAQQHVRCSRDQNCALFMWRRRAEARMGGPLVFPRPGSRAMVINVDSHDFYRHVDPRPRSYYTQATTTYRVQRRAQSNRRCSFSRFTDLPETLQLDIFEMSVDLGEIEMLYCPYTVNSAMREPDAWICGERRRWGNLPLLSVCQLSRNLMISKYGAPPSRSTNATSFPFDPKSDSIWITYNLYKCSHPVREWIRRPHQLWRPSVKDIFQRAERVNIHVPVYGHAIQPVQDLQARFPTLVRLPRQFPSLCHLGFVLQSFDECIYFPQSDRGQVWPATTTRRKYDPMTESVYSTLHLLLFQHLRSLDSMDRTSSPLPKLKTFSLIREEELAERYPSQCRVSRIDVIYAKCTRIRPQRLNAYSHPYSDWVSLRSEDLPSWRFDPSHFYRS